MFSLIVPVYKNEANIPKLLEAAAYICSKVDGAFEVVFVVDGSPDRSYLVLHNALPKVSFNAQLVVLSRNFGAFAAIRAGLERARGDYLAVMAADLQEPPELILVMYRALSEGDCDVAYGERMSRRDPWVTKVTSQVFWSLYRRIVEPEIPKGGVDIFACTSKVRDQLLVMNERNSSLIGQLFWVGFRRRGFPYQRAGREIGVSGWTFSKKWKYMEDSIFSFSDLPISVVMAVGLFGLIFSVLLASLVLISALLGLIVVPGYAATMLAILFFGMLNLLSIGILGMYLWRVFENTKGRPAHIIMSAEEFGDHRS